MRIGIAIQAAFSEKRTGVEEYAYQFINHLAMLPESGEHRFFLYTKSPIKDYFASVLRKVLRQFRDRDDLSQNRRETETWNRRGTFITRSLFAPVFWTQGRLALEMLLCRPDALFSPSHVLPIFCPENSAVTIHGLEFEYFPEFYPSFHLKYLRWATRHAANRAKKIIAVSQNTKDDLIMLYGVNPEKIFVIHHGVELHTNQHKFEHKSTQIESPYILFLGTKEKKKNISGLIGAFELLKEKRNIPHKLILAGGRPDKKFYKEENIKRIIKDLKCKGDIIDFDFVSGEEKQNLLKNAEVFVYPSFYEGFGMPILEAQAAGAPVITSNVSAMPEVAGEGALLVDPKSTEEIARAIYKVIKDENLRNDLIKKGFENVKKFSWEKCAQTTLKVLLNTKFQAPNNKQ